MSDDSQTSNDPARLAKILALADSPHEGEALAALTLARKLLEAQGLTLGTYLRQATLPSEIAREIHGLKAENNRLTRELELARREAGQWRERAMTNAQVSVKGAAETEKWRQLARHTADQLWTLGQQLHALDDEIIRPLEIPGEFDGTIVTFPKSANA